MVRLELFLLFGSSVLADILRRSNATTILPALEDVNNSVQNMSVAFMTYAPPDVLTVVQSFGVIIEQLPQLDDQILSPTEAQAVVSYIHTTFVPTLLDFQEAAVASANMTKWTIGDSWIYICDVWFALYSVYDWYNGNDPRQGFPQQVLDVLPPNNTLVAFDVQTFLYTLGIARGDFGAGFSGMYDCEVTK